MHFPFQQRAAKIEAPGTRQEIFFLASSSTRQTGSMTESIQSIRNAELSRIDGVDQAFRAVWRDLRARLAERVGNNARESKGLRIFSYLFGTRIDDFVDLLSLLKAAKTFDMHNEIASLKRSYEDKARAAASQYGSLAQLARSYGFGGYVDQIAASAEARVRSQIVAELGNRIKSKAATIGDVNSTLEELQELWGEGDDSINNQQLHELLFGATPMCAVVNEVMARLKRTPAISENEARVLLLVSDGMPTDGNPSKLFDLVKSIGTCIVTCFVSADDVLEPHVLYAQERQHWSDGARLMFAAASPMDDQSSVARELLARGWHIEPGAKLFIQINHSELLREFTDAITTSFLLPSSDLLPAGR
jgi:hypothetical protein